MTPHTHDRPFDLWIVTGTGRVSVCLTTVRKNRLIAQLLCESLGETSNRNDFPCYLYPEEWTE